LTKNRLYRICVLLLVVSMKRNFLYIK